jgi:hypothetical protein
MVAEFERQDGWLSQSDAAADIEAKFGEEFVYYNDHGNLAIARKVLDAFRELTLNVVVWDNSSKAWRRRLPTDTAGKRQGDG